MATQRKHPQLSPFARRLGFEPGCDGWLSLSKAAKFAGKSQAQIHRLGQADKIVVWKCGAGARYCQRSIQEHYTPKPF